MKDKELIKKIKKLHQIKPREEWVVFTKQDILGEEVTQARFVNTLDVLRDAFFSRRKLAYAVSVFLLVLVGSLGFAQTTVPGDLFFPLRKATEKTQGVFISEKARLKYDLGLVNRRLDDLAKVVENNQNSIEPAVEEVQTTATEAAERLVKESKENSEAIREVVFEVREIEEKKSVLATLGALGEEETEKLDNALKQVVEREIEKLEELSLTEEQRNLLQEAEENFKSRDYSTALEKVLEISNNQ